MSGVGFAAEAVACNGVEQSFVCRPGDGAGCGDKAGVGSHDDSCVLHGWT